MPFTDSLSFQDVRPMTYLIAYLSLTMTRMGMSGCNQNMREPMHERGGPHLVPCDEQGVHVADGPSGCEDAVAARESDYLPHLGENLRRASERTLFLPSAISCLAMQREMRHWEFRLQGNLSGG